MTSCLWLLAAAIGWGGCANPASAPQAQLSPPSPSAGVVSRDDPCAPDAGTPMPPAPSAVPVAQPPAQHSLSRAVLSPRPPAAARLRLGVFKRTVSNDISVSSGTPAEVARTAELPHTDIAPLALPDVDIGRLPAAIERAVRARRQALRKLSKAHEVGAAAGCQKSRRTQYVQADKHLLRVLLERPQPKSAAVWLLLGERLRAAAASDTAAAPTEHHHWQEADRATQRAIALLPATDRLGWQARYDLAMAHGYTLDFRAAIEWMAPLRQSAPATALADVHYRLGAWRFATDESELAMRHYRSSWRHARDHHQSGVRVAAELEWLRVAWQTENLAAWREVIEVIAAELAERTEASVPLLPGLPTTLGRAAADLLIASPNAVAAQVAALPVDAFAVAADRWAKHCVQRQDVAAARHAWQAIAEVLPNTAAASDAKRRVQTSVVPPMTNQLVRRRLAALVARCDAVPQSRQLVELSLRTTVAATGALQVVARPTDGMPRATRGAYEECLERWAPRYLSDAPTIDVVIAR